MRRILLFAILLCACGSTQAGCPTLQADTSATTGCLRYAIASDSRHYAPNPAQITFVVSATNVSASACAGSSELICGGPALKVLDGAGHEVWTRRQPPVACAMMVRLLSPGESMSKSVTWSNPSPAEGGFMVESDGGTDYGRAYFSIC